MFSLFILLCKPKVSEKKKQEQGYLKITQLKRAKDNDTLTRVVKHLNDGIMLLLQNNKDNYGTDSDP